METYFLHNDPSYLGLELELDRILFHNKINDKALSTHWCELTQLNDRH